MKLDDWRTANRLSYSELGRLLGVKPPRNARRYCLPPDHKDFQRPHAPVMSRIYELCDGKVTANDFYELPVRAQRKAATSKKQRAA